jgi:hypothetical protein
MTDDRKNWDDDACHAEKLRLLQKWDGGLVKFWDFTPTFSTLTLRVESREIPGNLHVRCVNTIYVRGPVTWSPCRLRLEHEIDPQLDEITMLRSGHFELMCWEVVLVEHVEPVYHLDRLARLNPAWRTARVVALAEKMQQAQTFDCLAELGEALQEAGCKDGPLLEHCRNEMDHGKECWVVDLVLGR